MSVRLMHSVACVEVRERDDEFTCISVSPPRVPFYWLLRTVRTQRSWFLNARNPQIDRRCRRRVVLCGKTGRGCGYDGTIVCAYQAKEIVPRRHMCCRTLFLEQLTTVPYTSRHRQIDGWPQVDAFGEKVWFLMLTVVFVLC